MEFEEKINSIIRHVKKVEDNCNLLARKLEDKEMAVKLVQLGRIHDASKFEPFEFEHLFKESQLFEEALKQHRSKNPHHPEYWPSIHQMPDIYIAEMVCDCLARSQEFGDNIRIFFYEKATQKYNFSMEDECGIKIQKYLDLLLTPVFS